MPTTLTFALGVSSTTNRCIGIPKEITDNYKYIKLLSSKPSQYTPFNGTVAVDNYAYYAVDSSSNGTIIRTTADVDISALNITKYLGIYTSGGESSIFIQLHN